MNSATLSALRLDGIYVRIMCEVLDAHGLNSHAALQKAGLALPLRDGSTVSAQALIALRRAFVARTDRRRELWSIVAGRYTMETTPSYGLASRTARDLEGIVRVLALNDLHSSFAAISPIRDDNGCLIGVEFDTSSAPEDLRPFEGVLALVSTIRSWDSIWAGRVPYRRLEVPPDVSFDAIGRTDHARVTPTDGRPRLIWDPEVSFRVLPGANEYLHQRYVQELRRRVAELRRSTSLQDRLLKQLRAPGGTCRTISQIAGDLDLSARTLQRTLAMQGVSFRELQDAVKRDLATAALGDIARSITSIASELGYASPSSFSYAFRECYRQTPSEYRYAKMRGSSDGHDLE